MGFAFRGVAKFLFFPEELLIIGFGFALTASGRFFLPSWADLFLIWRPV